MWRISAINEAGGWKDRTTVEDMDLSVRASLKGWKYIFLKDLEVRALIEIKYSFMSQIRSFKTSSTKL